MEDREQFDYQLTAPLPGRVRTPSAEELAREGEDFMALYAQTRSAG